MLSNWPYHTGNNFISQAEIPGIMTSGSIILNMRLRMMQLVLNILDILILKYNHRFHFIFPIKNKYTIFLFRKCHFTYQVDLWSNTIAQ